MWSHVTALLQYKPLVLIIITKTALMCTLAAVTGAGPCSPDSPGAVQHPERV